MKQYIVLLRAVNVGGNNVIKMAELKSSLANKGFADVQTYIQSGNIVLRTALPPTTILESIKELLFADFNLNIELFVLTKDELISILNDSPYPNTDKKHTYISFLSTIPSSACADKFKQVAFKNEQYTIADQVVYFHLPDGMANSKLTNNLLEEKLKVIATARNINTLEKIVLMLD